MVIFHGKLFNHRVVRILSGLEGQLAWTVAQELLNFKSKVRCWSPGDELNIRNLMAKEKIYGTSETVVCFGS